MRTTIFHINCASEAQGYWYIFINIKISKRWGRKKNKKECQHINRNDRNLSVFQLSRAQPLLEKGKNGKIKKRGALGRRWSPAMNNNKSCRLFSEKGLRARQMSSTGVPIKMVSASPLTFCRRKTLRRHVRNLQCRSQKRDTKSISHMPKSRLTSLKIFLSFKTRINRFFSDFSNIKAEKKKGVWAQPLIREEWAA